MAKKIIATIAAGIAVLLVWFLALSLLFSYKGFFGDLITWLMVACVGILMVVTFYIMIERVVSIVKRKDHDEELLDEAEIEEILNTESMKQKATAKMAAVHLEGEDAPAEARPAVKRSTQRKEAARQKPKKAEEKKPHRAEEADAQRTAEAEAEAKRRAEEVERARIEAEAKAQMIEQAKMDAVTRAAEAVDEDEKKIALAEAKALGRASAQAEDLARKAMETSRIERETFQKQLEEEQKAAEERKQQAIESARKQAEAAAAARRRAAQRAAQTQSFAPITTETLQALNSQVLESVNKAVADSGLWNLKKKGKAAAAPPPVKQEAPAPSPNDDIWTQMNVKQSAAPVLSSKRKLAAEEVNKAIAEHDAEAKLAVPPEEAEPKKMDRADQTWRPAKLPGAWQKDEKPSIPGDMGYASRLKPADAPAPTTAELTMLVEEASVVVETKQAKADKTESKKPEKPLVEPLAAGKEAEEAARAKAAKAPAEKPAKAAAPVKVPVEAPAAGQEPAPVPVEKKKGSTRAEQAERLAARTPITKEEPLAEVKRGRGRPPKPKTEEELNAPKRPRGRPPKPKTEEELNAPKRPRGRPPKPKTEEELNAPKRPRGRPPKPKTEEELNAPKRPRGRPPKPKTEEELNAPKRPRGRPPKPKTEAEAAAPKRPRGRPPKAATTAAAEAPKRPRGRPPKKDDGKS